MLENVNPGTLYFCKLGEISVGKLPSEVVNEIFQSGRVNYRIVEADIARHFSSLSDIGGLGGADFHDSNLGDSEAKSYRLPVVKSKPEEPLVWSARSGCFDKRNKLSPDQLEEYIVRYCESFEYFAYYDISQIGRVPGNPYSVVFVPSIVIKPYLKDSLYGPKSKLGYIPFVAIQNHIVSKEVLD